MSWFLKLRLTHVTFRSLAKSQLYNFFIKVLPCTEVKSWHFCSVPQSYNHFLQSLFVNIFGYVTVCYFFWCLLAFLLLPAILNRNQYISDGAKKLTFRDRIFQTVR